MLTGAVIMLAGSLAIATVTVVLLGWDDRRVRDRLEAANALLSKREVRIAELEGRLAASERLRATSKRRADALEDELHARDQEPIVGDPDRHTRARLLEALRDATADQPDPVGPVRAVPAVPAAPAAAFADRNLK